MTDVLTRVKLARDQVHERYRSNKLVSIGVTDEEALNSRPTPLLVKISADVDKAGMEAIADVCMQVGVDGIVCSNTTVSRPDNLHDEHKTETGGLSGEALFDPSTRRLAEIYKLTKGEIPLIGVGGVGSGEQAYKKIIAGASLVQLYTGLVYKGPKLVSRIKRDLNTLLKKNGFSSVSEAVGAAHRVKRTKTK